MRRFFLFFAVLSLAVSQVGAADTPETRSFRQAKQAFIASAWPRADEEFGIFVATFNTSTNVPEAVVLQAQAKMKMNLLSDAADILSAHLSTAGGFTAEYLYWLGQIYSQGQKHSEAATYFGRLAREFPESPRRLEAALDEAVSLAKTIPTPWQRVAELLSDTNGAFRIAATASRPNELVYRGGLQLAEAQFQLKDFEDAEATLRNLEDQNYSVALSWQRQLLLCRTLMAEHRPEDALTGTTNLITLAGTSNLLPESYAMQATVLEQLDRLADAIAVYKNNLGDDVPIQRKQQAVFKIAELSMILGKWDDAIQTLQMQNTNSPVADVVTFTLGELQLRKYVAMLAKNAAPDPTNLLLNLAATQFQSVLDRFPNGDLVGKAMLDKGWCFWFKNDITNSGTAFSEAAQRLTEPDDAVIARFKWADTQYRLGDFSGAAKNYSHVVTQALASADSNVSSLVEPALYQLLRTSLDAGELTSVNFALTNLLALYPNTFIADRSLLLAGQGFALKQDTARARSMFLEAEKNSPLQPEIQLAIARTYEQEQNWSNAISVYDSWLVEFTNNPAQPTAEYYRAWATFQGGNDTNALNLFTQFVGEFPTNALAVTARWWIGDYYFRNTNYVEAEKNFQSTNLASSSLAYDALMMAGRSAVARAGYPDAITYFTKIANEATNSELRVKALFAYGDTLVSRDSTNKVEDLQTAIGVFGTIFSQYGTNLQTSPAWGKIGECYSALAKSDPQFFAERATNAFAAFKQLIDSPLASVAARRQAKIEKGDLLEKQASLTSGTAQNDLLNTALRQYQDVILEENGPETGAQLFWKKKACQEAARLCESLNRWDQAIHWYAELKKLLPSQASTLDKRIEKIVKEHPEAVSGKAPD